MVLDPQELWHQGTRPSPLDPFRHATLWRSRLGATPAAAPGRCGRMPWTWLSPVEVAKSSASFITRLSWGSEIITAPQKEAVEVFVLHSVANQHVMWCRVTCVFLHAHLDDLHAHLDDRHKLTWVRASEGLVGHRRSERQCMVGQRPGPVTDVRPLFCSCCITTDKTWAFASPSVVVHSRALKCFVSLWLRDVLGPLCPLQTILMRSLYRAKSARWLARCGNADKQQLPQHARERRESERPRGGGRGGCAFLGATLPTVLVQFLDVHIVSVCRSTNLDPVMEEYASRVPIASQYWPTPPSHTTFRFNRRRRCRRRLVASGSICLLCLELNRFCVDTCGTIWTHFALHC